jgi:hypothetical protein
MHEKNAAGIAGGVFHFYAVHLCGRISASRRDP